MFAESDFAKNRSAREFIQVMAEKDVRHETAYSVTRGPAARVRLWTTAATAACCLVVPAA